MKTSLRVSREAVGLPCRRHKERRARMRFLCKVPFYVKVPTFLVTTALQHCFKSSCRASSAGGARGARALPMRRPRGIASLMTVSLFCRWFLSHFSSAVGIWLYVSAGSGLRDGNRTNFTPRFRSSSWKASMSAIYSSHVSWAVLNSSLIRHISSSVASCVILHLLL